jgi:hypothetical protein
MMRFKNKDAQDAGGSCDSRFGAVAILTSVRWLTSGPWLMMRFERVTLGVDLEGPLTRSRAAIAAASG